MTALDKKNLSHIRSQKKPIKKNLSHESEERQKMVTHCEWPDGYHLYPITGRHICNGLECATRHMWVSCCVGDNITRYINLTCNRCYIRRPSSFITTDGTCGGCYTRPVIGFYHHDGTSPVRDEMKSSLITHMWWSRNLLEVTVYEPVRDGSKVRLYFLELREYYRRHTREGRPRVKCDQIWLGSTWVRPQAANKRIGPASHMSISD